VVQVQIVMQKIVQCGTQILALWSMPFLTKNHCGCLLKLVSEYILCSLFVHFLHKVATRVSFEALEEHGEIPGEESGKIKLPVTMDTDIICASLLSSVKLKSEHELYCLFITTSEYIPLLS